MKQEMEKVKCLVFFYFFVHLQRSLLSDLKLAFQLISSARTAIWLWPRANYLAPPISAHTRSFGSNLRRVDIFRFLVGTAELLSGRLVWWFEWELLYNASECLQHCKYLYFICYQSNLLRVYLKLVCLRCPKNVFFAVWRTAKKGSYCAPQGRRTFIKVNYDYKLNEGRVCRVSERGGKIK